MAVDGGGGWAGLAFGLLATLFVERVMDAIQNAINAPVANVPIDGAARRQLLGKVTPLASGARHVHHGVERRAHVGFASAASPPRRRNERFDMRPFPHPSGRSGIASDPACISHGSCSSTSRPPNRPASQGITTDS